MAEFESWSFDRQGQPEFGEDFEAVFSQAMGVDSLDPRFSEDASQHYFSKNGTNAAVTIESALTSVAAWVGDSSTTILRVGLGVIYLWFGALKFAAGWSPAEDLILATVAALGDLFFGITVPGRPAILVLAVVEVAIGLCFLSRRTVGYALALFAVHVLGTALPLVLLPELVWKSFPFGLTMEGQYIVKNLSLVGGAIAVATALYGRSLSMRQHGHRDEWEVARATVDTEYAEPDPWNGQQTSAWHQGENHHGAEDHQAGYGYSDFDGHEPYRSDYERVGHPASPVLHLSHEVAVGAGGERYDEVGRAPQFEEGAYWHPAPFPCDAGYAEDGSFVGDQHGGGGRPYIDEPGYAQEPAYIQEPSYVGGASGVDEVFYDDGQIVDGQLMTWTLDSVRELRGHRTDGGLNGPAFSSAEHHRGRPRRPHDDH